MDFTTVLCDQFHLQPWQVNNVIQLLDEGNTIPFIARYRKEAHGTLDDQVIRELSERLDYLRNLQKRKEEVGEAIAAQEAMTGELQAALDAAATLAEVEDIYRPYRPKRMTRATKAKERGLEPLAQRIYAQEKDSPYPIDMAAEFVNPEKEVETPEDALSGALDIIAEEISDDAGIRRRLRVIALSQGVVVSRAAKPDEDSVYSQYYDYREPAAKIAGHRVLAIDRGEREEFLKVSLELDQDKAMNIVNSVALKGPSPCYEAVSEAAQDAYTRLIFPSVERELRSTLSENAQEAAIKVFSVNLRNLLMQPPVKGKVAMGLDPGYRTGCKVAVVDATGRVLDTGVIYPTHSQSRVQEAKALVSRMIQKYQVEVIAIGNGTASKETEMFTAEVLSNLPQQDKERCAYMVVSEAGASVYSASKLAAEEFPQFDLTLRSAVSIARRLQDPLAELVKIDPKAIGVGQYQHDMPPAQLSAALDGVVESCVNTVGVDLNTASAPLLARVAGVTAATAKNIVKYREDAGAFKTRRELLKVPKLGPKAFEQCAGFLRVPESENVLDRTAVHPESYRAAEKLLSLCGYTLADVGRLSELNQRMKEFGEQKAAEACGVGLPTLRDIAAELQKPGRDPRDELPPPLLRTDVMDMNDLKPGMQLTGTVRNVVDFGAFVDIGVHQDGLVHVSQITDRFIRHPSEVLTVGDVVEVTVLEVDVQKKRISLTMKKQKPGGAASKAG